MNSFKVYSEYNNCSVIVERESTALIFAQRMANDSGDVVIINKNDFRWGVVFPEI